ncbi:UHRF1-binding protein 1 [Tachyglossus aculeatus]|uniref:UHRF1-binding protein 1 n=1 Tax=Tachyglossus aculeatus TaxID=9261 RepID=UPI0018F4FB0A|nr:UHRF1-binding protein 1 [Tachyglossus aculeatus]
MAGLIKKQILKHLSRFTKNLSPDKINLSTLKGEGQLTNLELDEEVLQNVLELPTWLAITRVYCNKASIRIQWTKLKTHPIYLCLDKVEVEMRTCEEPRPPNGQSPIALAAGQSEYGFAEKVVEGMFIVVNSITIKIHSKAFHASFELWQLQGYSVNPSWQQSDLRFTRITDPHRGEVLTFKELTWQTLRIEADATDNGDQEPITTPLRLITNQGRIQIALKRRTKDCNVMASKLMFLLDDLLWVLTDSQLKAMMKYAESLSEAMEKAAQQRKSLAPEPVQLTPPAPSAQQSWAQAFAGGQSGGGGGGGPGSSLGQYFEKFDVKESSYHLIISRLDLHICDDSQAQEAGVSANRVTGGAMQLTFRKMDFDYYPFHRAGDSCKHWVRHCEAMETRAQWAQKLVLDFQKRMEKWSEEAARTHPTAWPPGLDSSFMRKRDPPSSPLRSPPEKSPPTSQLAAPAPAPGPGPGPLRLPAWSRLRSSCVVVRVDDLDIYQVSTAGQSTRKPSTLLSCSRKLHNLPPQVSAIHIEFTEYYFPDNQEFPVPCPNLYVQLNGLTFTLHPVSLLWGNLFSLDLYRSLRHFKAIYKLEDSSQQDEHLDTRLDAFQVKVSIPLEKRAQAGPQRPQALAVSTSAVTATNTRHAPHCSHLELQNLFRRFAAVEFFHPTHTRFPKAAGGFGLLHPLFLHHAFQMDLLAQHPRPLPPTRPAASQDLWSVRFARVSLDFEGAGSRAVNFVAPFPLSVWACLPTRWDRARRSPPASEGRLTSSASLDGCVRARGPGPRQRSKTEWDLKSLSGAPEGRSVPGEGDTGGEAERAADVHVLLHSPAAVRGHLDHYQYLALLRLKEALQSLQDQLAQDTRAVTGEPPQARSACLGVLFPGAEVALLMPPTPEPGSADSETTSLVDSEFSPPEERDPKSDVSSDRGSGGSPGRRPEDGGGENPDLSRGKPPSPEKNGLAGGGPGAVEAKGPPSPAGGPHPPVGKERVPNGQAEPGPLKNLEAELPGALHIKDATKEAFHATVDLTREAVSLTKDAFSLSRDRMTSTVQKMLSLPPAKDPLAKADEGAAAPAIGGSARLRFFSLKRTTSQQSFDGLSLDGSGLEDQISVDSDGSDGFVMLLDAEPGLESVPSGILHQTADDAGSRGSPGADGEARGSPAGDSLASCGGKDPALQLVSGLVLKVTGVTCAIDAQGEDLAVALQAEELALEQPGNVGLWQLLRREGPGDGSSAKDPGSEGPATQPSVSLRFEVGSRASLRSPLAAQNGFLRLVLRGCDVELLTSVLNGLGPFLEDEEIPVVIPMHIELLDARVTLKDDGPPIYPTSPGPVPVTLAVEHIVVERDDEGVFHLAAAAGAGPSSAERRQRQEERTRDPGEQTAQTSAGVDCGLQAREPPSLRKELEATKHALAAANQDKEKLLQEVRKYNPLFQL